MTSLKNNYDNQNLFSCVKLEDVYKTSLDEIKLFTCDFNPHLADFLINKAYEYDKENESKTYLILSNIEVPDRNIRKGEVVAYFSLRTQSFTISNKVQSKVIVTSHPTLEISQFAINSTYINKYENRPKLGKQIFSMYILPIAQNIQKDVGVKYISLYAADFTLDGEKRLIKTYESFGFKIPETSLDDYIIHVDTYDLGCQFMFYIL